MHPEHWNSQNITWTVCIIYLMLSSAALIKLIGKADYPTINYWCDQNVWHLNIGVLFLQGDYSNTLASWKTVEGSFLILTVTTLNEGLRNYRRMSGVSLKKWLSLWSLVELSWLVYQIIYDILILLRLWYASEFFLELY